MQAQVKVLEHVSSARPAFRDRGEAGRELATALRLEPDPSAVVLALPRGGVPVAAPIAKTLRCPLHVIAVRKLPLPDSPEMGFGAVTVDGTVTLNHAVMRDYGVGMGQAALIIERVEEEVRRRAAAYHAEELPQLIGRRVYLVDDGLATGYTMIAACEMVRHQGPSHVAIAVPVAPSASVELLSHHCDRLTCLIAQDGIGFAVASFYDYFPDLTDAEVRDVLAVMRPA